MLSRKGDSSAVGTGCAVPFCSSRSTPISRRNVGSAALPVATPVFPFTPHLARSNCTDVSGYGAPLTAVPGGGIGLVASCADCWLSGELRNPTGRSARTGLLVSSRVTSATSAGVDPTVFARSKRLATFTLSRPVLSTTLTATTCLMLRSTDAGATNQKLSVKPSPSASASVRAMMLRGESQMNSSLAGPNHLSCRKFGITNWGCCITDQ